MVKAIIDIDKETNRVINVLKSQFGLTDKSQAINEMARQYRDLVLESDIKPEYLGKFKRIQRESIIRIGSAEDFRKRYGLK
jgi:hypothetical protein